MSICVPEFSSPMNSSPPQRTHTCAAVGAEPQSIVASEPYGMPTHSVLAAGVMLKEYCTQLDCREREREGEKGCVGGWGGRGA